jgi:hypothetical protein
MESFPMCRPYDLFHEGPQKRQPRVLGFDDVICDLWCSGVAFEGLNDEGVDLNLDVGILYDICGGACWGASRWPIGP